MKENITCRYMFGRWWDVFVREDGSITMREIPNLWDEWPDKYKRLQEAKAKK